MKKLGYGLMRLPHIDGSEDLDVERVKGLVDVFLERGFTYFDTAYAYQGSENAFKEAVVKRYPREAYSLTNKIPMRMINEEHELQEYFDQMLERSGVDYFNYTWLHALGPQSYDKVKDLHAFEFLQQKKDEGKTLHIGFSYHGPADVLDKYLTEYPEVEAVQLQINYLDWNDPEVQSKLCYEVACKHNKPVIIMEPVKGGTLANVPDNAKKVLEELAPGMSYASSAIRFAASLDNVMMVLSGMSDEAQVDDNTGYMMDFKPFNQEEMETLIKLGDEIRTSIAIPCTACHYCTPGCPMNIAIPEYFSIYNDYARFNNLTGRQKHKFQDVSEGHGLPSECIKCGNCEVACPQNLTIRDYLEQVAEEIEAKI